MRKEVKIRKGLLGFWEVFDWDSKKVIYKCDTELKAYRFVCSNDYKLIY